MTRAGTMTDLWRWPVKSVGGEPVAAARLDVRGIAGDRAHAVYDVHRGAPRRLTARHAPRLLRWSAAYPDAPGAALDPSAPLPVPRLRDPEGTSWSWEDPDLAAALSDDLGRPVTLRRDPALMQDLADSILVTTQATLEAAGAALGRPLDLRRFRTNIHLVAPELPAYAEHGWEGRRLRVGDVLLELLNPCVRCVIPTRDPETTDRFPELMRWLTREQGGLFGINARATAPGRIAVGDTAELL